MKLPNQRRNKKTGVGAERDRARRAAETADQRSERLRKLRVRDRAKCTTQVLVKDKPPYSVYFTVSTLQCLLYSRKVRERRGKETSEERETKLQWMRDRLAAENSERDWRLQQTRTNQNAKLAVETRGEITLQQRSTNQREWLAV